MEGAGLVCAAVFWMTCVLAAGLIGEQRGSYRGGIILGLLLGPLGIVATLGMDWRAQCGNCGGRIDGTPKVCPHCRVELVWNKRSLSGNKS